MVGPKYPPLQPPMQTNVATPRRHTHTMTVTDKQVAPYSPSMEKRKVESQNLAPTPGVGSAGSHSEDPEMKGY
jgi:hypothetical protein